MIGNHFFYALSELSSRIDLFERLELLYADAADASVDRFETHIAVHTFVLLEFIFMHNFFQIL